MKTTDFNTIASSAMLNENMFKKFGTKINFDKYTREDLENYRNLLRTKLNQTEGAAGFNDLLANESYQKDKFMLNLLNTRIKEMLGESATKYKSVSCSQCGNKFGPGNSGFSSCKDHKGKTAVKEGIILEKSTSEKQARTMAAAAHNPKFAKKVGIKKNVAKEFNKADTGTKQLSKAMKNKPTNEAFPTVDSAKAEHEKSKNTNKFDSKKTTTGTVYTKKKDTEEKKVKEDLKGAQKKLDVAKPKGKLDKKDFAALRSKKKVKESTMRGHYRSILEGLHQFINEDEEGKAKDITAGSDMVNDFTSWMQRVGQYQTKSMIELADSIRANFGQAEADAFRAAITPALQEALSALTQSRETITRAVAVLAGEESQIDPMGQNPIGAPAGALDAEIPAPGGDLDSMNDIDDEFGASDAAAGGAGAAGREMRESRARSVARAKRLSEAHSIMSSLSK